MSSNYKCTRDLCSGRIWRRSSWTEGISRFVISISYDTDEPAQNYDPSENIQCIDSQSNDVDIAGGLT